MRNMRMSPWRAPIVLLLLVSFLGSLVPTAVVAQPRYNRYDPGNSIDRLIPGADYPQKRTPYDGAGNARLGRTLGGAAGIAAGSFGGAALAAAVIKGAGLATMGPVVPILVGSAITAGGAFLGAKLHSSLGQSGDRALGPGTTWTLVGAIAGSMLGYAFIPALGPFAGTAGRIIAAGVAGLAGGILAKLFAPQLDKIATPRNIYAGTGAVIGAVGFGPVGAIAGAAGGYALGAIFGDNFFADKRSSPSGYMRNVQDEYYNVTDKFRDFKYTISDWFGNKTDRFGDRMRDNWDYYDRPSAYYDDYYQDRSQMYDYIGRDQQAYLGNDYYQDHYQDSWDRGRGDQFSFDYSQNGSSMFDLGVSYSQDRGGSLMEIKARRDRDYQEFQSVQRRGDSGRMRQALERYNRSESEYREYQRQYGR